LHGPHQQTSLSRIIGMRRAALLLIPCVLAAASFEADARARSGRQEVVPAENRVIPADGDIPGCQDTSVLGQVSAKFAEKEARFWNSSLTITAYEQIQRIAWRPWGLDYIPRRFCTATATISDGTKRRIDYSVREDLGIAGAVWGVHFCVHGLDRNYANAPACRMARP
jgi:hypothetical protein